MERKIVVENGIEYTVETDEKDNNWWSIITKNGNYILHRENGPAIEGNDNDASWYLHGDFVYDRFKDNTGDVEMTEEMKMSIIKHKLRNE